jgi:putative transposase
VFRWFGWAIVACFRSRASLVTENICLRQQLLVLRRRQPRPGIRDSDRRFWVLACRWSGAWRGALLIVKPETVLRWHRRGWKAYWHWRSRRRGKVGRRPISPKLRTLIQRMATENRLWGQRRIQAELARLGFKVSARSVAKYMRRPWDGKPFPGWRRFLKQHASMVWACDFLCVETLFFKTLYVFFVIDHASREVLHVGATRHPTAEWTSQQIVECCGWDREAPNVLIHDRDSRYGVAFNRKLRRLGITQIRTPFRSPQANSIAERWVRSLRTECLDHMFILNERHLRMVLAEYVHYFNHWRPHRSIGQRAPCAAAVPTSEPQGREIMAEPVLGGLHHTYRLAA